jgi:hypothetical protein
MHLAQKYRDNGHFLSVAATPSSRHETMVGGALTRALPLRVGLGVGGAFVIHVIPDSLILKITLT